MSNNNNEKLLIGTLAGSAITVFVMILCLLPNGPRVIFNPKSTPAEVESDDFPAVIVRRSLGFFEVTAYCPCEKCCGKYADGITASGYIIQYGDRFVATSKIIPFGTEIIVDGYNNNKPVKVLDRGGAIKVGRLDIYFDLHKEALEWGRQYCVEVWTKKGKENE